MVVMDTLDSKLNEFYAGKKTFTFVAVMQT